MYRITLVQPRDISVTKFGFELQPPKNESYSPLFQFFDYSIDVKNDVLTDVEDLDPIHCFFCVETTIDLHSRFEGPLQSLTCHARGLFSFPHLGGAESFNRDHLGSAMQILFGFVRGYIFTATSTSGLGLVMLPAIDFNLDEFGAKWDGAIKKINQKLEQAADQRKPLKKTKIKRSSSKSNHES